MTRDELEYSLSQYHDGTLPPLERATLDERLASDAEARAMLAELGRLDALLKSEPMPELAWDQLQSRISSALDQAEPPAIRTFKIGAWARVVGGAVALAATIAIVVSVVMRDQVVQPASNTPGSIQISIEPAGAGSTPVGPTGDSIAIGPAITDVGVGPSPQMPLAGWSYESAFLDRPSRVVIAVSPEPVQDGGSSGPF
ncbi:hypothetical protein BH09PLA1_BH09PLA1_36850 [soil metagenome]